VNSLISEEVQHGRGVNVYFYLLKVGPAERWLICGLPWIYYVIEHFKKHPLTSPGPSPWRGKVSTTAQFLIF